MIKGGTKRFIGQDFEPFDPVRRRFERTQHVEGRRGTGKPEPCDASCNESRHQP
jgi:hypothetical protein